jgi:hypothetical protein
LNLLWKRSVGTEFIKSGNRLILEFCLENDVGVLTLSGWSNYGEWRYVLQIILCHIRWVTICFTNCSLLRFGEWRLWVVSLPRKVVWRTFSRPSDCWSYKRHKQLFTFAKLWDCFLLSCDSFGWFFWEALLCVHFCLMYLLMIYQTGCKCSWRTRVWKIVLWQGMVLCLLSSSSSDFCELY